MAKSKSESLEPGGGEQGIEELRKRYEKLNEKRITAQANRERAEKDLADLRKKARDEYQTDDLGELQKKLKEMIANNERMRADYQQHLDGIEAKLKAVEKAHGEAQGGGA